MGGVTAVGGVAAVGGVTAVGGVAAVGGVSAVGGGMRSGVLGCTLACAEVTGPGAPGLGTARWLWGTMESDLGHKVVRRRDGSRWRVLCRGRAPCDSCLKTVTLSSLFLLW